MEQASLLRATSAVKPSSADFISLAENLPQLAWMADASGWVFWYNRRWYEYTGTTPAEMEGWGWQAVHDPGVLPSVLERWQEAIATGEPFDMVFPLKGADGVFRPFLTRVQPLRDEHGRITRWFGTNTDISEQQRTADSLAAEKRQLETLNQTITRVSAELDLERLVQTVTDAGVSLTGAQFGAFFYNVLDARGRATRSTPSPVSHASTSPSSRCRATRTSLRPRSGAMVQ